MSRHFVTALGLTILCTFPLTFAAAQTVEVSFKISPAGNFQAKSSKLVGKVKKVGDKYTANDVSLDLSTLDTTIALRDDHMKNKYLEVQKYPKAELSFAEGSGGKGKGKLKVRGIEKPIEGTYTVKGKTLEAKFEISLSEYNITGIRYLGAGVKDKAEVTATLPIE